jgi:hypothetical protein
MELDEKELRKQIREILLNSDELMDGALKQKKGISELKKDCYTKLVDLKNEFEADKGNPNKEETIKKIDSLIAALNQIKSFLGKQL